MKTVISWLLALCLTVPNLSPFSTLMLHFSNSSDKKETTAENGESNEEGNEELTPTPELTEEAENKSAITNSIELDIEGYCTLKIPQSYLKILDSESTSTKKTLQYKDNITKLTMSYITNIDNGTDIPGYVTNELAKVDTTTNKKTEETYGNNITWVKIPSDNMEDGCNVYVWYTVSKSSETGKQSVFWVKAKVNTAIDNSEFQGVVKNIFDSYSMYAVSQGSIFDTPDSGYYKDKDTNDNKAENTSEYKANTGENTVFQKETGIIETKDISKDWEDLEMLVDNKKISVPCSVDKLYNAGFEVYDSIFAIEDEDYHNLSPQTMIDISFVNSNGTVIEATFMNESATEVKKILECNIFAISIDYNNNINQENGNKSSEHNLVLPGGVTWKVYKDALIELYGSSYNVYDYDYNKESLTWTSREKEIQIVIGKIHTISYVKISCLAGKEY